MRAWFYDTWGFVALAMRRDLNHAVASQADRWAEEHGIALVTTDYVVDEMLTHLQVRAGAPTALAMLDALQLRIEGGQIALAEINSVRREAALDRFRRLAPKVPRLSFTDCTSFAVMEELGISVAVTADRQFHQAGAGIRPLFDLSDGTATWVPPEV